jgi:hypothetical protein
MLAFTGQLLAGGFIRELKDAVRDWRPFSACTGLPEAGPAEETCYLV